MPFHSFVREKIMLILPFDFGIEQDKKCLVFCVLYRITENVLSMLKSVFPILKSHFLVSSQNT